MQQTMLTDWGHLLVTSLKLPSSQLGGLDSGHWGKIDGIFFLGGEEGKHNILDFWKVDKEMVRETNIMNEVNLHTSHLGSFI